MPYYRRCRASYPVTTHIGYKMCRNNRLVTLAITGRHTTEHRPGICDATHVKMRCSQAFVLNICDAITGKRYNTAQSGWDPSYTYYRGRTVRPNHYDRSNAVCAAGIHYFLTPEAAKAWWVHTNAPEKFHLCYDWDRTGLPRTHIPMR